MTILSVVLAVLLAVAVTAAVRLLWLLNFLSQGVVHMKADLDESEDFTEKLLDTLRLQDKRISELMGTVRRHMRTIEVYRKYFDDLAEQYEIIECPLCGLRYQTFDGGLNWYETMKSGNFVIILWPASDNDVKAARDHARAVQAEIKEMEALAVAIGVLVTYDLV